jgi:hypothetical protein
MKPTILQHLPSSQNMLVKVSAAVGAVLGLADVAMHSCICSVTGVCTLADKATHSYICSVTSVCIYGVYKHVAPTFLDQSSTIDLLFCSTEQEYKPPEEDSYPDVDETLATFLNDNNNLTVDSLSTVPPSTPVPSTPITPATISGALFLKRKR